MRFRLRQPCENCPFRKDVAPFLDGGRAAGLALDLVDGQKTFTCHKTINYNEWDEESNPDGWKSEKNNHCVGAIQFIENCGQPHQMLQIAERLGLYDPKNIDRSTPCFGSIGEFVKHHGHS